MDKMSQKRPSVVHSGLLSILKFVKTLVLLCQLCLVRRRIYADSEVKCYITDKVIVSRIKALV